MKSKVDIVVSDELKEAYGEGSNVKAGGYFTIEHYRDGKLLDRSVEKNIVVDEGLTHILDVAMSGGVQTTTWYLAIYSNNYTPLAADTAATITGNAGEITTEIDETVRPTWTEAGVASKTISNIASPGVFTANATVSAYGAFLVSSNTLGSTSGTLCAAAKFASVRNLVDTDVLNVVYTLVIADA